MARIRHIALVVEDSEKSAEFYTSAFGMSEVLRAKNNESRGQWVIYLTDGYINLALLPIERKVGVDHIGFAVDDVHEGLRQAIAAGGVPPSDALPTDDGRQAETYVRDPYIGVKLDISRGWLTAPPDGPRVIDATKPAVKA
jgi:catechol 2,3-dioxygenase-like lactoylglutathione lyase family enzyme